MQTSVNIAIPDQVLAAFGKASLERDLTAANANQLAQRLDDAVKLIAEIALGSVNPSQIEVDLPNRTWKVLPDVPDAVKERMNGEQVPA